MPQNPRGSRSSPRRHREREQADLQPPHVRQNLLGGMIPQPVDRISRTSPPHEHRRPSVRRQPLHQPVRIRIDANGTIVATAWKITASQTVPLSGTQIEFAPRTRAATTIPTGLPRRRNHRKCRSSSSNSGQQAAPEDVAVRVEDRLRLPGGDTSVGTGRRSAWQRTRPRKGPGKAATGRRATGRTPGWAGPVVLLLDPERPRLAERVRRRRRSHQTRTVPSWKVVRSFSRAEVKLSFTQLPGLVAEERDRQGRRK